MKSNTYLASQIASFLFLTLAVSTVSSSTAVLSPEDPSVDISIGMEKNKRLVLALVIASSSVAMILILAVISLWIYGHKILHKPCKKSGDSSDSVIGLKILNGSADCKILESATRDLDNGCVYKAQLEEGRYVMVKKVEDFREFKNEVDLLNKIKHQNVIALLSHCVNGDERYLVYELMEKGSLEEQLHGLSRGSELTWNQRMKVALDVARGLEYLHENCSPPVIHRDLNSSNILLDSNFNAKLSQFGLSASPGHQNKTSTELSGQLGYVAPEYLLDGKMTDKSDVYAFGVILLELLLGRKPVEKLSTDEPQCIVKWALPWLTDRSNLPGIVAVAIRDSMDLKHLYQVAAVAVLCVQAEPSYRPLITDVLHSLIPLVPTELGGTLRVQHHLHNQQNQQLI